jgi:hypothetical protein
MTYAEVFTKYPYIGLAYNNYGNILRELGLPKLSYGFFATSLALEPNNKIFNFNLSIAYLIDNNLEKGWDQFESRWGFKNHEHTLLGYTKPRWEGQDLKGKRLLVTCEEGDGDNIQFSRFTEHLESLGAHVIHQTEPQLKRLFSNSFKNTIVITNQDKPPEYDYWTPILSIPRVIKLHSYDDMPYIVNYLTPTDFSIERGRKLLGVKEKLRVGFCWGGRTKSFPFDKIIQLIKSNPHVQWVNFQISCSHEEQNVLQKLGVTDISSYVVDWEDTAGIMSHMDLMVTIDTGLCHVAGSMGIPCVLMLDKVKTCWRWLLDREDTVWYPSVRIFKQISHQGYDEQLARVNQYINILKL